MKTSDAITKEQLNILLDGLKKDGKEMDSLYCFLQFYLGLRVGDLLNLKWEHITKNGAILTYITYREEKTGKYRNIKLTKKVKNELKKYYNGQDGFIINHNGNKYTVRNMNYKIKNWRIDYLKNSIEHFSTHSFRKGFGKSVYDNCGRTDDTLQKLSILFNHSSILMTRKYIGITKKEVQDLYDYA